MSFKIIKNIITKKKEEDECANSLPGETLAEYNIPEENVGNEIKAYADADIMDKGNKE